MRIRFIEKNVEKVPTESKRFAMDFSDLTDKKEYVVYALRLRSDGLWYLICTDRYDVKKPNVYSSIPWYFHEAAFEVVDSHLSDSWIEVKDEENNTKDYEHPLMAEDPYFYGEWIDKEKPIYFEKFARIKNELDAEDAFRSELLNIKKQDTKIILIDNANSPKEVFDQIKKNEQNYSFPIDSWNDLSTFLMDIEYYVSEQTLWILFGKNCSLPQEEQEKLKEVLRTAELYWIEHSNLREFRYYLQSTSSIPQKQHL
ncbi:MAG: hypothetical protein J6T94_03595 [Bacteroidaceae bacterium]|nr:hypothetical protein [Bacteroidaceae bacterium]MBP5322961.1 hypothetical protein [Bacteroidaceae bacterium]